MKLFSTMLFVFLFAVLFGGPAHAASVTGTFEEAIYEYVQIDDEISEKQLTGVKIKNGKGQTVIFSIDSSTPLSVNNIRATIDAFKTGMPITASVSFRRIQSMSGTSNQTPGAMDTNDRVLTGTVNRIDPNGRFVSVIVDKNRTKTYNITNQTEMFKGTRLVDLSALFEGDRVKLTFATYNTSSIQKLDIIEQGTQIERLVKGTIQSVDPLRRKVTLKNETAFTDWKWDDTFVRQTSYTYTANTPIYVGNQLISMDKFRYYRNHPMHFATVRQMNKEVISHIVIQKQSERTFYEPITAVSLQNKYVRLRDSGLFPYHNGTILIRNGRLVDENSLPIQGSAFVIGDGQHSSEYANVIHITNDGFESPNLTSHSLYFGRIDKAGRYDLTLTEAFKLTNNTWQPVSNTAFTFSNNTHSVRDFASGTLKVVPQQNEVQKNHIGDYGYFYAAAGNITAIHLLEDKKLAAQIISVGRFEKVENGKITIRNVSKWTNGNWEETGRYTGMDVQQTTFIRAGQVISVHDIKKNDRLYIVHESTVKGRIVLVD